MAVLTNLDYQFLYSQLPVEKIPKSLQEKVESGKAFTDSDEKELIHAIYDYQHEK